MDQQVKQKIENEISNNDVCLFMKGTPSYPNVVSQWRFQIFLNYWK